MKYISLVLAMASNGMIGVDGGMPWHIPEDMKHFKEVTMGKPIVMGRKTWDSFPKKPLPGRENIVITRDPNWRAQGAVVANSLDGALARTYNAPEVAVIGGAQIYKLALPRAQLVHLTEVHSDFEGDTRLALFDKANWHEASRENHTTADGLGYSFVTLERRL